MLGTRVLESAKLQSLFWYEKDSNIIRPTHTRTHTHTHTHEHTHMHAHTHTDTWMHIHTPTHTSALLKGRGGERG